jgi:two-component system sensor histidine kinase/response regulator
MLPDAMHPTPRPSAVAAAGQPELQPLAAIDGLDIAAGLRQCGNRAPMYRHMLTRFAEIYAQPLPAPTEPEGEPDLPVRERAHSLRGASATVGAVRVQALAAALEALCDDASAAVADRQRAHDALNTAVAALVTRLREALAATDAPKAG